MKDSIRVTISSITLDEIIDGWGEENGVGRSSPRWLEGKRLAVIQMTPDEASALKQYLQGRFDLVSGPGIDREPGELPRLRRDIARISGV